MKMEQILKREMIPSLKGAHVLLVEDDFLIAVDVEMTLTAAGADVAKSRTVRDGLALADDEDLAAAILDIRLGRESVAPVARRLAERGVPFFFYSGQVDTDAIRAEWPHCKIIPKPARPQAIVLAIAQAIEENERSHVTVLAQ
jgi:DNA-binding NtrC family response regulator